MGNTYTIQKGDTLSKIAKAHGTTVGELARLNDIKDPNKIKYNTEIILFKKEEPQLTQQTACGRTLEDLTNEYEQLQRRCTELEEFMGITQQHNLTEQEYLLWQQEDLHMQQQAAEQQMAQQQGITPLQVAGATVGGIMAYKVAEKALPIAAKGVKTGAGYVWRGAKAGAGAVVEVGKNAYKAGKGYAAVAGKKIAKGTKYVGKMNKMANNILAGKTVTIARKTATTAGKSVKLTGAAKVLGRAAVPIAVVTSAFEIGKAYQEGGTKAAVKTGAKCATGLAGAAVGAKAGAVIGTAICPGIGTAIGSFVGGVAGFVAGEWGGGKLFGKLFG